jgi:hypothetical protein
MLEGGNRFGFPFKSFALISIDGAIRQHLDCNGSAETRIPCPVTSPMPPAPNAATIS